MPSEAVAAASPAAASPAVAAPSSSPSPASPSSPSCVSVMVSPTERSWLLA